jgi:hypothetical protein
MHPHIKSREGVLSGTTFPVLVYSIMRQKETGILTLTGDAAEKSCYLNEGRPTFATSSDRDDRLTQILMKGGAMSMEVLMECLDRSLREQRRLGAVLLETGAIPPHALKQALQAQVSGIIASLFQWTRGWYRFMPGQLPPEDALTLELSPGNIILEGIRKIESWQRIWEAVGNLDVAYRIAEGVDDLVRELHLSLEEWTLLTHLDRSVTVRELCRVSPIKDFEICRLLWALSTLGIISRVDGPA